MDKVTKKKSDKYVPQVINALQEKYGVTTYYIRQCVAGRIQGILPDKISGDYKNLTRDLNKALDNFKNQKI